MLVGQDGVQRTPIHFPRGGHLLACLSCLENGLLPHGQMDPPLWSQRGTGKHTHPTTHCYCICVQNLTNVNNLNPSLCCFVLFFMKKKISLPCMRIVMIFYYTLSPPLHMSSQHKHIQKFTWTWTDEHTDLHGQVDPRLWSQRGTNEEVIQLLAGPITWARPF